MAQRSTSPRTSARAPHRGPARLAIPVLTALVALAVCFAAPGRAQTPQEGPGGPILVITNYDLPLSYYYAEILRNEGFNEFEVVDIRDVHLGTMDPYDVVILAETTLNSLYPPKFQQYLEQGGNVIAFRPDPLLYPLAGVTAATDSLADGYLKIDDGAPPGRGLVGETIQYHGPAAALDLAGAAAVADLYTDAATPANRPAVTLRDYGTAGGQIAVFAYDLARSVVLTRQGNPDWAGQDRDGDGRIRTNDLFVGDTPGVDDWIDLDKVAIPQADEQQRLLANLILHMNQNSMPLPRFWYFPQGDKAVVLLTEDNHGTTWCLDRFDQHLAESPPDCVLADWECVRSTSYIYASNPITDAQAAHYDSLGFEVSIHTDTGCDTPWPDLAALQAIYDVQFPAFTAKFLSIHSPLTERAHCVTWADYDSRPIVQEGYGIRLDVTYYYERVAEWQIDAHPGMFTGSGMPMRFVDLEGNMLDVFQATTQMTDESGQTYPHTIDSLLDAALGPQGYYGAFTANMHADYEVSNGSLQAPIVVASAQQRGVPVIASRQMLAWLDARNASSWQNLAWDGGTLLGDLEQAPDALHLEGMLPAVWGDKAITQIDRDGLPVSYAIETIKGVDYAVFEAEGGSYAATWEQDLTPPVIADVQHTVGRDGSAVVTWTTDEAADSRVEFGTDPGNLDRQATSPALVLDHSLELSPLDPDTVYYYRVASEDVWGNGAVEPPAGAFSFTTPHPVCFSDDTVADFVAGESDEGIYVSDTTDGEIMLAPELGAEFDGAALPDGWSSYPADPGGTATVVGGWLELDGARAHPDAVFAPPAAGETRSLEFVASFQAAVHQHAGFGITLQEYPYAIFSTSSGGATLYAHTRLDGSTAVTTDLGADLLGAPHLFRIEWMNDGVDYYVDGTFAVHHDLSPAVDLHPVAFDRYLGGPVLAVDWFRMGPYATAGVYASRVFDALSVSTWGDAWWTVAEPAGTTVALSYRTGDTAVPDASWTAYTPLASPGDPIAGSHRYFQYRAELTSGDDLATPRLDDFALTCVLGDDVTPPAITALTIVPGPAGTTADVTWETDEPSDSRLDYGTDPGDLALSAADPASTTSHSLQLVGLTPGTLYYCRASSTDPSSNTAIEPPAAEPPASFNTPYPPCLSATTSADFGAGVTDGTYVSETQDGEVILAPAVGAEFSGDALPDGWTLISEAVGGSSVVAGGVITVNGSRPGTADLYAPGRSLEFVATFEDVANQHVGFGETFGEYHWAIFSTGGSGTSLKARTRMDDVYVDDTLPAIYQGTSHLFRIDWYAGGVDYSIDGVPVAHHDIDVTAPLRPLISDTTVDAIVLTVDWLRMTPYAASGSYWSPVYDAGETVSWDTVDWTSDEPAGTSVLISVRGGPTPDPDASWTDFMVIAAPGSHLGTTTRYIQYRVDLDSDDPGTTPRLTEFGLTCGAATAVDPRDGVPTASQLRQNHPNPFNPSTTLSFSLARRGAASLRIYSLDGRLVRTLFSGMMEAGDHEVVWNGKDDRGRRMPSSAYFARLVAPDRIETRRLMMIK